MSRTYKKSLRYQTHNPESYRKEIRWKQKAKLNSGSGKYWKNYRASQDRMYKRDYLNRYRIDYDYRDSKIIPVNRKRLLYDLW